MNGPQKPIFQIEDKKYFSRDIKVFLNGSYLVDMPLGLNWSVRNNLILLMSKTFLWGFQQKPIFQGENSKVIEKKDTEDPPITCILGQFMKVGL